MGFIGVALGILLVILIYGEIEPGIDCPNVEENAKGASACDRAKQSTWSILGVLPITLFFFMFTIFGGWGKIL
jgi:uncharacterized membrane protein